ncbi:unnamed protein product [Allacma fusca]|uniref:Uncharacterized protein n=1 Tax=Allacma fusca TaxID=39272 RepID=A0A8J2NVJ5_9HEXA|nr:unnamed protein product [Allacma fusca]
MESCLVEWQGPRPKPDGDQDKALEIDDGRQSRVSRRQILQATWLLDTDRAEEEEEELIVPHLTPSMKPPHIDYDSDSTLTDDTDTHTYAFADAHDEVISIASSATLDSESLQGVYNPEEGNSPEMDLTAEALALDVKRVREIFEQRQKPGRNPKKENSPQPIIAPNLPPRNFQDSGVTHNKSNNTSHLHWINKSPLSQSSTHLNQLASYDLVDLLVNDRVVIEDSPDIFQTVRSTTKSTKR